MDWYWRLLGIIMGLLMLQMGFGQNASWGFVVVGGAIIYICIFTKRKTDHRPN
jgi:hypothetical protein